MSKVLLLLLIVFISACDSNIDPSKSGELLFQQVHIGKNNVIGCISCHSLNPEIKTVGPSLFAIGLRAGLLVKNQSAKQYLKQAIINPDAYIVGGYTPAIMFAHYKDELSQKEIDQLVEYLMTLR